MIKEQDANNMYKIGTKAGILKGKYSRNQFTIAQENLLRDTDINHDENVTLREAVISESLGLGQGIFRCNCSGQRKRCGTNRCKCFKSKVKCNSKCHNSLSCTNK